MSGRPTLFASKTGVGTTGPFLCSNARGELGKFPVPCHGVKVYCRGGDAERRLLSRVLYVTVGTDIAITAISAPTDVPLLNGVRPRSAWEPAQTRCLHVMYVPPTGTACPVSLYILDAHHARRGAREVSGSLPRREGLLQGRRCREAAAI